MVAMLSSLRPEVGSVSMPPFATARRRPVGWGKEDLVGAGAAGRDLADALVAVGRVPDAEAAGAFGDRVLGGRGGCRRG